VEHVIAAAARLRSRHPGLTVAVVGDGWWAENLHEAARSHGVADIVEFTGHVSEEEKARQVDRAWVLALPSLKEGWGLVVMEAASRAVPAVAYADAGGVTESIADRATGVLVRGEEADFIDALDALLSDTARRQTMGARARERSAQFSWDASAKRFEELLIAAVHAKPKGQATSWSFRKRRKARRP
jgi:glycosyltransferase involved in cell wall biosynthesis